MKILKGVFPFIVLLSIVWGCAGTFEPPTPGEEKGKKEEKEKIPEREYDPLGLKEDLMIVPEQIPLASVQKTEGEKPEKAKPARESGDTLLVPGSEVYRVQLFTSKEYGPAMREMNIAAEVFDQRVWLDYEVPYYKVRVGDFFDRDRAEEYAEAAVEAGYNTAWVVKVNLDIKKLEDIYENEPLPAVDSLGVDSTRPGEGYDEKQHQED
jgi:hypothetical protein